MDPIGTEHKENVISHSRNTQKPTSAGLLRSVIGSDANHSRVNRLTTETESQSVGSATITSSPPRCSVLTEKSPKPTPGGRGVLLISISIDSLFNSTPSVGICPTPGYRPHSPAPGPNRNIAKLQVSHRSITASAAHAQKLIFRAQDFCFHVLHK